MTLQHKTCDGKDIIIDHPVFVSCLLLLGGVCLTCVSFLMTLLVGFALSTANFCFCFVLSPFVSVFQSIFIFSLCIILVFSLCSSSLSRIFQSKTHSSALASVLSLSSLFAHMYNLHVHIFIFKHVVRTCAHTTNERHQ